MFKSLDEICEKCERLFLSRNCICTKKCDAYKDIAKRFKALEIIKEKEVDVFRLLKVIDFREYNNLLQEYRWLTKEEFDLLKEVFKDDGE